MSADYWRVMMTDNRVPNGKFGAVLGGMIIAVALAFFLFIGDVDLRAPHMAAVYITA